MYLLCLGCTADYVLDRRQQKRQPHFRRQQHRRLQDRRQFRFYYVYVMYF